MRVLVNISSLSPPLTGIGWYTFNLLQGLLGSQAVGDVNGAGMCCRYSRTELVDMVLRQPQKTSLRTGVVVGTLTALKPYLPRLGGCRHILHNHTFQRARRRAEDYLYWEPNYILKPFAGPAVATVHDLSHIRHPEYHPAARVRFLSRHLQQTLERAQRIVVVSEFTRSQVLDVFSVPSRKLSIVSPGVAPEFRSYPQTEIITVLNRYKLRPGYILSVGTLEPRKNVIGLAKAWLRLPDRLRRRHPLVLVGCQGWQTRGIEKQLAAAESRGELIRLGYVRQQDLPCIYGGARLMAYLSFYEGFGMPVAEAMACGTPVLTSNCASMPEVAGGSASLVNPRDCDDILTGLLGLLEDDQLCYQYGRDGQQQIGRYTWLNSLTHLLDAFRLVRGEV